MKHLNNLKGCLSLIDTIRSTDRYIRTIYTQGGCYQFHLLLKAIYPDAKPWLRSDKDHVVTELFGNLLDIDGIVDDESDYYPLVSEQEVSLCEGWSFYHQNKIVITDCPHCDEPISFDGLKTT